MLQFNTYYHIYNHAFGDDNHFREQKNYPFFLEKNHQHIDPSTETIAWCLMPNHFHLLIKIKNEADITENLPQPVLMFRTLETVDEEAERKFLNKQFSNFFSSYSQAFNKVYHKRDSLYIKNFKQKELNTEEYLRTVIHYSYLNPVKHGFSTQIVDWTWTFFPHFYDNHTALANNLFGNPSVFLSLHQEKQQQFEAYKDLESVLTE